MKGERDGLDGEEDGGLGVLVVAFEGVGKGRAGSEGGGGDGDGDGAC